MNSETMIPRSPLISQEESDRLVVESSRSVKILHRVHSNTRDGNGMDDAHVNVPEIILSSRVAHKSRSDCKSNRKSKRSSKDHMGSSYRRSKDPAMTSSSRRSGDPAMGTSSRLSSDPMASSSRRSSSRRRHSTKEEPWGISNSSPRRSHRRRSSLSNSTTPSPCLSQALAVTNCEKEILASTIDVKRKHQSKVKGQIEFRKEELPAFLKPSTLPSWHCSCDYENDGIQSFCGICATPKVWCCAGCNSENKCMFNYCGICGIPKTVRKEELPQPAEEGEEDKTTAVQENQWKCKGCDQINTCPNIFCSMCGSSKMEDAWVQRRHSSFPPPFVLVDEQIDPKINHVSANSLLFDDSTEWWSD
jgi:hypothetical protein